MKSEKNISFLLMIMLISCNKNLPDDRSGKLPWKENIPIELDKETIYNYQTNKDVILYGLIQYNYQENTYFLAATAKDIEKLGVSIEAYEDVKIRIEQMNLANITLTFFSQEHNVFGRKSKSSY